MAPAAPGAAPHGDSTSTLWLSPAGQLIDVPRHTNPPPGPDTDPTGTATVLPDPDELHLLDQLRLTPTDHSPPWLPADERDHTRWTILDGSEPPPF